MRDRTIKEFNKQFLDELNKSYQVQESLGKLKMSDVNDLHGIVVEGILHMLYSYFPTILIFNPMFFIFSNLKSYVERKRSGAIKERTSFQKMSESLPSEQVEQMGLLLDVLY